MIADLVITVALLIVVFGTIFSPKLLADLRFGAVVNIMCAVANLHFGSPVHVFIALINLAVAIYCMVTYHRIEWLSRRIAEMNAEIARAREILNRRNKPPPE